MLERTPRQDGYRMQVRCSSVDGTVELLLLGDGGERPARRLWLSRERAVELGFLLLKLAETKQ